MTLKKAKNKISCLNGVLKLNVVSSIQKISNYQQIREKNSIKYFWFKFYIRTFNIYGTKTNFFINYMSHCKIKFALFYFK